MSLQSNSVLKINNHLDGAKSSLDKHLTCENDSGAFRFETLNTVYKVANNPPKHMKEAQDANV